MMKFKTLENHRKAIIPIIKARNKIIFSGVATLSVIGILGEIDGLLRGIINYIPILLQDMKGMLFELLMVTAFIFWMIKIYFWITQVKQGRGLVTKYQETYSRFVFQSIGDFLQIDMDFATVQVSDNSNNITLATSQTTEQENLVRQALYNSQLVHYDPRLNDSDGKKFLFRKAALVVTE